MEILTEFLARTINQSQDSIKEKLYKKSEDGTITSELLDNALDNLLALDQERVSKLKTIDNADISKFKKMGQAEAMEKLEKQIKELYKIEKDARGIDLISELVATVSKSSLDEDKIKIHPAFIEMEKRKMQELEELKNGYESKINTIQGEYMRNQVFSKIDEIALSKLNELKPIISSNPTVAANQKKAYLQSLREFEYQLVNDELIPMQNGKRIEDGHGNPLKLEHIITTNAAGYFEFEKQEPKGSAGNQGGNPPGATDLPNRVPKTREEYTEIYYSLQTAEQRVKFADTYKSKVG